MAKRKNYWAGLLMSGLLLTNTSVLALAEDVSPLQTSPNTVGQEGELPTDNLIPDTPIISNDSKAEEVTDSQAIEPSTNALADNLSTLAGIQRAAVGDTFNDGTFYYNVNSDATTVSVVGTVNPLASSISIPATATDPNDSTTYDVVEIGNHAFSGNRSLHVVDFSSALNLKSIGDYAFGGCWGLWMTGLATTNSVTTLGTGVYYNCSAMGTTDLENNTSVVSIGDRAFYQCFTLGTTGLESNHSVETIGASAFRYCNSLTGDLVLNASVTSIGDYAFSHSFNTYERVYWLTDGESTSLGDDAFEISGVLRTLYVPESVQQNTIGGHSVETGNLVKMYSPQALNVSTNRVSQTSATVTFNPNATGTYDIKVGDSIVDSVNVSNAGQSHTKKLDGLSANQLEISILPPNGRSLTYPANTTPTAYNTVQGGQTAIAQIDAYNFEVIKEFDDFVGNNTITAKINASKNTITEITVNGDVLTPADYTIATAAANNDNTKITLKKSYLKTLANGTYTIEFKISNDTSITTTFNVHNYKLVKGFDTYVGQGDLTADITPLVNSQIKKVKVNGTEIAASDYNFDGSSVITLNDSYLQNLTNGEYEVIIALTKGQNIKTTLTVEKYNLTQDFDKYVGNKAITATIDTPTTEKISQIMVDGNLIAPKNYTVTETADGQTVIKLKKAYLNSLANQMYSISIELTNGQTITTNFEVEFYTIETNYNDFLGEGTISATLTSDITLFSELVIDGESVDAENYTIDTDVETGYSVITLNEEYLQILTNDTHIVQFKLTTGQKLRTTFAVHNYVFEKEFDVFTGSNDVSAKLSAPLDLFSALYINGELIDGEYYDLTEGSTIVTLKSAYLKTLANADYTVTMALTTGQEYSTNLTVNVPATPVNPSKPANKDKVVQTTRVIKKSKSLPSTGEQNHQAISLAGLLMVIGLVVALGFKRFKRNKV